MSVYIKNTLGQQTVRQLPFLRAIWLRLFVILHYKAEDRPIVKFVI